MRAYPVFLALALALFGVGFRSAQQPSIAHRIVDPRKETVTLHWKNERGSIHGSIGALKADLESEGKQLLFAMNGGMYTADHGPVGLYVEDGRMLHTIDRRTDPKDNFHMQPNGVFGLYQDGRAFVKTTTAMDNMRNVRYATQSGPMLLVDGVINKNFTPGSKNLNIRNGVGLMADGRVLFAISQEPVNFHDFASWFKEQGCVNALYLDGFVSKAFIPEAGVLGLDGELGVLIAVTAVR